MSKFTNKTDSTKTVKFSVWGADGAEMPRNAAKAEGDNVFKVKLDNKSTEIRKSTSRGGATYYYAKLGDKWMWTRDEMTANQEFAPYVKPEPAPKPEKAPKVEKVKTEKPAKVATAPKAETAQPATPAKTPFTPPATTGNVPSAMTQVNKTADAPKA
jgi:hypothetical protein